MKYMRLLSENSSYISDMLKESFAGIATAVEKYAEVFRQFGIWETAIEKMAEKQIIFTEVLSKEILDRIIAEDDVESIVLEYYTSSDDRRLYEAIDRCKRYDRVSSYTSYFDEIIQACKNGSYHLACTGLFAMLDGILADASPEQLKSNPKFIKRIDALRDKMNDELKLSDLDVEITSVIISLDINEDAFFNGPRFNENEDCTIVNRNWIVHGHTHRAYGKLEFIKVLLLLEAIIILANAGE